MLIVSLGAAWCSATSAVQAGPAVYRETLAAFDELASDDLASDDRPVVAVGMSPGASAARRQRTATSVLPEVAPAIVAPGPSVSLVDAELRRGRDLVGGDPMGTVVRRGPYPLDARPLSQMPARVGAATGPSSLDLIRALFNRAPGEPRRTLGGSPGDWRETTPGLFGNVEESVLEAAFNEGVTEVFRTVLDPKVSMQGFVEFSIAGFGSFALILAEETGNVFLVDLDGGTAVKIYQTGQRAVPGGPHRHDPRASQAGAPVEAGVSSAFRRFVTLLKRQVFPVVTSPITFMIVGIFLLIWLVWRIAVRGG